jgi:DUF4097 and DUF4098 domain-containing protein YvlB
MRSVVRQAGARLVVVLGAWAGLAHGMDSNFEKHIAADPHGVVEISNVAGHVEVQAWDKPEVEVRAQVGGGVERIDTTSDHGRISIKVIVGYRSSEADLHIHVPRDSELDISAVSADVVTSEVEGTLQLKTVSGKVKADVFQQNAEVKTLSGDVDLRGHGKDAGSQEIHVSTVSSNIRIEHAGADLEAITISGDINVRLDQPARHVRIRTTSGALEFNGKLAQGSYFDAESVSGRLSVRAAVVGSLDYEVSSFSGDIRSCMGGEAERVSQYGPGHRLNGTRGKPGAGEAKVRLKTMSGNIELCDKT